MIEIVGVIVDSHGIPPALPLPPALTCVDVEGSAICGGNGFWKCSAHKSVCNKYNRNPKSLFYQDFNPIEQFRTLYLYRCFPRKLNQCNTSWSLAVRYRAPSPDLTRGQFLKSHPYAHVPSQDHFSCKDRKHRHTLEFSHDQQKKSSKT